MRGKAGQRKGDKSHGNGMAKERFASRRHGNEVTRVSLQRHGNARFCGAADVPGKAMQRQSKDVVGNATARRRSAQNRYEEQGHGFVWISDA